MKEQLIAPCGINCGVCAAHLALEHDVNSTGMRMRYCEGCRTRKNPCAFLAKRCDLLLKKKVRYCFECPTFPCERLSGLDEKYRLRFQLSMVENLKLIRDGGIESFLKAEERKWRCTGCGGPVSCHNGLCFACDIKKLKAKKKPYEWDDEATLRFEKRKKRKKRV